MFKRLMAAISITTPSFLDIQNIVDPLTLDVGSFPLIAKLVSGGSSIGTCLLKNYEEASAFFADDPRATYGQFFLETLSVVAR